MTAETMVVTDLDGDGKDDIIVASQSDIRIFHYGEYHFDQVAEYRFKLNKKIHALSVLPAAQGTTAHLLVSADGKNLPSSVIMSWNGSNTLQVEHNAIRWYVRAVTMPGKGTFIAGQQLKPGTDQWQLAPYIYRLVLNEQSGKLMNKGRLALPEGITLFDFVYADLNNDKKIETVVIDAHQKLLLYNSSNELIWVSSTNYGGGLSHFGPSLNAHVSDEEAGGRILNYIPGRLEVSDLDNDGSWEIIVNTNTVDSKLLRFFPNLRHFNSGAVSCLGWNDGALQELWRTNTINGYVADYAFKSGADAGSPSPAGNSGRLFVVQTQGKSLLQRLLPGSDTSKIFMYALEFYTFW
ncbi:MAG: hypothetical protein CSA26_12455 [Desulfobacterales bacterium]|nr:MAG: hypothetical protein CSA26_12455 [Desulfobacterales bacterium]